MYLFSKFSHIKKTEIHINHKSTKEYEREYLCMKTETLTDKITQNTPIIYPCPLGLEVQLIWECKIPSKGGWGKREEYETFP